MKPSTSSPFNIIFDLDGTLIDSHPAIFESLKFALSAVGFCQDVSSSQVPIGPPLLQLIQSITGTTDRSIIDPIIFHFKSHYDSTGFASSCLFDGVYEFLSALHEADFKLYIATNKRLVPALRILKYFAIDHFFEAIYAVDSSDGLFHSKSSMLKSLICKHSLVSNVLYLGDRLDDYEAALANSISFRFPCWGYSNERALFPSDTRGIDLCTVDDMRKIFLE